MLQTDTQWLQWENLKSSGFIVYLVLFLLLLVAQIMSPGFLAYDHMSNVLRQASFLGIVAIGQTLVILIGGIDLSVAPVITLANVLGAEIMAGQNGNIIPALLAIILMGLVVGLINGCGVHFLKITPLIMTLGMGSVVTGIALVYTRGAPKGSSAPLISFLSNGKILNSISGVLLIWIILSVLTIILLKSTLLGRYIYSVGTNVDTARYSGIRVGLVTLGVHGISGIMAAVAGFLLVGYTGTSYLDAGTFYELNSIAAVVVGGTSILGGEGGYTGTIAGAIIMTVIGSLMTTMNMPHSGRQIAQGLIILALVLTYAREKKMK